MTQPHHHDLSPHEVIPIGSGYNQVSQEMSKKSLDASNFDALTKYTNDDVDIQEVSSRTIDASTFVVVHRCRVIKRTESVRLNSDFKWEDAKIGDYGTAYFSDISYGGIMEIEVETRSHESLENLSVKAEISSNNGQILVDTNEKSTSVKCSYYGGMVASIPTSTNDIGKAFSEFIKSVSANSTVEVKREIQPFPVNKSVMISTGCYNYIKAKKEECLYHSGGYLEDIKILLKDIDG
ncbi:hypothetical protein BG005_000750, partial [Podila minutissima]